MAKGGEMGRGVKLWIVATLLWSFVCFMMLPHAPGMAPAFAFAIGVPSGLVFLLTVGLSWALAKERRRSIRVSEILPRR